MHDGCAVILAQAGGSSGKPLQVLALVGLLIALTLLGGLVVFIVRRKLLSKPMDAADDASLMGSLKHLRDTGQISDAEYETTRKAMAKRAVEKAMRPKTKPKSAGDPRGSGAGPLFMDNSGGGASSSSKAKSTTKNQDGDAGISTEGDGDGGTDGGGDGGGD